MKYVCSALNTWQNQNNIELFRSLQVPLIAMIIRKSTTFNRQKICDNDNLENGRIINEIFDALGFSDNALLMDIHSCFRLVSSEEKEGVDFIIFPLNLLEKHLDLIVKLP